MEKNFELGQVERIWDVVVVISLDVMSMERYKVIWLSLVELT